MTILVCIHSHDIEIEKVSQAFNNRLHHQLPHELTLQLLQVKHTTNHPTSLATINYHMNEPYNYFGSNTPTPTSQTYACSLLAHRSATVRKNICIIFNGTVAQGRPGGHGFNPDIPQWHLVN